MSKIKVWRDESGNATVMVHDLVRNGRGVEFDQFFELTDSPPVRGIPSSMTALEFALCDFVNSGREFTTLELVLLHAVTPKGLSDIDEPGNELINASDPELPHCAHGIPITDETSCVECDRNRAEREENHKRTHCHHDVPLELPCRHCVNDPDPRRDP